MEGDRPVLAYGSVTNGTDPHGFLFQNGAYAQTAFFHASFLPALLKVESHFRHRLGI